MGDRLACNQGGFCVDLYAKLFAYVEPYDYVQVYDGCEANFL